MENNQDQPYQSKEEDALSPENGSLPQESENDTDGEVAERVPGVSVVRGNTPRPLPFEALLAASDQMLQEQAGTRSVFPGRAPSAPPLPEELEADQQEDSSSNTAVSVEQVNASGPQEFIWLFEYALEMESAFLNSSDRLDGAAFLYGPAVLRGHMLMFAEAPRPGGQFLSTIVPSARPDTEVWGMLYRVPRRVTMHNDKQVSLLDRVHSAGTASSLFTPVSIIVRETYREREISCGTYALTTLARQQLRLFTPEQADTMTQLVRRIATLARKQRLPSYYLNLPTPPASVPVPSESQSHQQTVATLLPLEQNTDPLPALRGRNIPSAITNAVPHSVLPPFSPWLATLAVYLSLVLLCILAFAFLQGIGFASHLLTPNLHLFGVPWLVLIYGVLGGSVSSIIALAHVRRLNLPFFAVILWFVRPFIGGVLALFAYLLLDSGLFAITNLTVTHTTLLSLIGALAGLCEGRLFLFRR